MQLKTKNARISSKTKRKFKGHVYNVTTDTGNLFVEDVLVCNSGGLGTPAHLRVEVGLIHKANKGVLFIDELSALTPKSQQELLTAMQEKKYSITGQSEMSSGSMVRTEAVPCFTPKTKILTENGEKPIGYFVDSLMTSFSDSVEISNGVETLNLPKDKFFVFVANDKLGLSELQRVYRKSFNGKLIRLTFDDGTEILTTPEHPIKTEDSFVKANEIKENTLVETVDSIVNLNSSITTYSLNNQRMALTYLKWKKFFLQSNKSNYAVAKQLGVDHKVVANWKNNGVPMALHCVNWFEAKNLLNLALDDPRLSVIAKLCGALFGDGGISKEMKKIYFCTDFNSQHDLSDFSKDLITVFGESISNNIKIRKTQTSSGAGLELSLNNAFVARFFNILGVPKGDKVMQAFAVPNWVYLNKNFEKEFFSSLIFCELYGKIRSSQDTPTFVMAKLQNIEKEHVSFLNEIRSYLIKNGVKVSEIIKGKEYFKSISQNRELAATYLFKIRGLYGNMLKFSEAVNAYYATTKGKFIGEHNAKGKIFLENKKNFENLMKQSLHLRSKGKTIRQLEAITGISKNTILKNIEPTYKKYSEEDMKRVFFLLEKGFISKQIAKKLMMPYQTVLYWKNNYWGAANV